MLKMVVRAEFKFDKIKVIFEIFIVHFMYKNITNFFLLPKWKIKLIGLFFCSALFSSTIIIEFWMLSTVSVLKNLIIAILFFIDFVLGNIFIIVKTRPKILFEQKNMFFLRIMQLRTWYSIWDIRVNLIFLEIGVYSWFWLEWKSSN